MQFINCWHHDYSKKDFPKRQPKWREKNKSGRTIEVDLGAPKINHKSSSYSQFFQIFCFLKNFDIPISKSYHPPQLFFNVRLILVDQVQEWHINKIWIFFVKPIINQNKCLDIFNNWNSFIEYSKSFTVFFVNFLFNEVLCSGYREKRAKKINRDKTRSSTSCFLLGFTPEAYQHLVNW